MSFDGDLEHLPIVDVIQLLHATRKTGTLSLRSPKGESQLVFHDGSIVSANHVDNSVRIGQVLLDLGLITAGALESALHEQRSAGARRKPIIQTMIEGGAVQPEAAFQGLEALIEMTIVEVLTWSRGTFSLEVDKNLVSDEYSYLPDQLKQEFYLNTQSVLMDALRIYDERKRDGTLTPEAMFGVSPSAASDDEISVTLLGLDELDDLERAIPHVFSGLEDLQPEAAPDRLQLALAGIPAEERRRLLHFLDGLAGQPRDLGEEAGVILLSGDRLIRECVAAVCGPRFLCATDDPAELDPIIDQSISNGQVPLLLLDAGEPGGRQGAPDAMVDLVRQKGESHPELAVILLTCPGDYQLNTRALQAGIGAVLPRFSREERPDSLVSDAIDCTRALQRHLARPGAQPVRGLLQHFKRHFLPLSEQREPPEITFLLLQAVGAFFQRAVTLVAVRSELIAERGVGIGANGAAASVKLRIPVSEPSLFEKALQGEIYYGDADPAVRETLFTTLGAPTSQKILLLPVKSFGRVIALIYGDFGARAGGAPQPELLEILALHAGLVIDNALYRKRCAQKAAS